MALNPGSGVERDPVCGMMVDPATAAAVVDEAGKRYYFCCPGCAKKFQIAPDQYLRVNAASSGLVMLAASKMPQPMVGPIVVSDAAAKDPVCGMSVNPESAKYRAEYCGKTYFFCHRSCLEKFKAKPEDYLSAAASVDTPEKAMPPAFAPSASGAYVCPMCPQVRESKPGP